ncbi:MAG: hypothetical protein ACP5OV_02725 [Acidimicrobiales bacterium]
MSVDLAYLEPGAVASLVIPGDDPETLPPTLPAALARRLGGSPAGRRQTLGAWSVERRTAPVHPFSWSAATARRALGRSALRRLVRGDDATLGAALAHVLEHRLDRAASGYADVGSLGAWLARLDATGRATVMSAAQTWALSVLELTHQMASWSAPESDAYYAVDRSPVTLRGRRDVVTAQALICVRAGRPSATAGAGLRVDLLVAGLTHPAGELPAQVVGVWPDAGLALRLRGSVADARRGARYVLAAAVAAGVGAAAA